MLLSEKRIAELQRHGLELIRRAEDVPLGSLAYAIAKEIDCSITLWPYAGLASDTEGERAIVYLDRSQSNQKDYIIMYAPSQDGRPGSMDLITRFTVAHELAHIALRHPMQNTVRDVKQEMEAHFLALLLLGLHGAPVERCKLLAAHANAVLDRVRLASEEKEFLLGAAERFIDRTAHSAHSTEWNSVDGWLVENGVSQSKLPDFVQLIGMRVDAEHELRRFRHDGEYRAKAIAVANSALEMAMGIRTDL